MYLAENGKPLPPFVGSIHEPQWSVLPRVRDGTGLRGNSRCPTGGSQFGGPTYHRNSRNRPTGTFPRRGSGEQDATAPNALSRGHSGQLVEAAGIEPASANDPDPVLHA